MNFTSMQHMTFKRALRTRYTLNLKKKLKEKLEQDLGLFPEQQLARESYPDDEDDVARSKLRVRRRSMSVFDNNNELANQDNDTHYDYYA